MSERTCGNCRWYDRDDVNGSCRRNAPQPAINDGIGEYQYFADWPTTMPEESCGQWADGSITPQQEERRELVRRFAVAMTSLAVFDGSVKQTVDAVWIVAQALADAEPGNSGHEI